eukprot:12406273-Karenia_brevis.AAC.1
MASNRLVVRRGHLSCGRKDNQEVPKKNGSLGNIQSQSRPAVDNVRAAFGGGSRSDGLSKASRPALH